MQDWKIEPLAWQAHQNYLDIHWPRLEMGPPKHQSVCFEVTHREEDWGICLTYRILR